MKRLLAPLAALVLLLAASPAVAHDVAVWAEVVKGKVHVEAYFSDGSPVGDTPVAVADAAGKVLLNGRTNDKGVFDFVPPKKTDLTITVSAPGHESKATVKAADLDGEAGE